MTSTGTSLPGQPLGSEYMVFESIGRGAMGEVRRAQTRDGSAVAVKLLHPAMGEDPELVSRFLRERTILTGLHHPNVVTVRDLVAEGSTLAIVMDLVEGRDLRRELIANGPLPAAKAAELISGVARGLDAVHAAGVVHRDVKPENVLLARRGPEETPTPQISDFGISSLAERTARTHRTGAIGTPEYMAPELIGDEPASNASDLYAVGIMLYELLCGVTPFQAGSALALMNKHVTLPPPRPDGIPDPLWSLIAALLAKEPEERPSSAGAVAEALDALAPSLTGLPALPLLSGPPSADTAETHVHPLREETTAEPPQPPRRRKGLLVGSGVLALVVVAGVVAAALAGGDDTASAPKVSTAAVVTPTSTGTDVPISTDTAGATSTESSDPNQALPDFTDQPLSEVVDTLKSAGIAYTTREVFGTDAGDNVVVEQDPAAGEAPGSRVTLTVAREAASVFLSDLGSIGQDPETSPVDIRGKTYSHPVSGQICGYDDSPLWEYDLGQQYRRLTGTAGMVDDSSSAARATVEIFADGRKLWGKGVALGKSAAFDLDVTEVLRLKIVVTGTRCDNDMDVSSYVALGDSQVLYPRGEEPSETP